VVGTERLLAAGQHTLSKRDRFGEFAFIRELDDLGAERFGIVARLSGGSRGEDWSRRQHYP